MNISPHGRLTRGASSLQHYLEALLSDLQGMTGGEVASYIPELTRANPEDLGIALVMADGRIYQAGAATTEATIQSVSKPFMYGAALARHGRDHVLGKVGVEPTGERFNSIILDEENNRPFNPMVNAGAIATAALLTEDSPEAGEAQMLSLFSRLAGRPLRIDPEVFRSEHETGHRNRAIAWMMLNSAMIEPAPDLVLDLYFKQCSVLVSCTDLALMAATLAMQGTNPVTGEQIFAPGVTQDVLSVMTTCGMYDYAGQWLYDVGLPAKSGVSGMIMAVTPGQMGLAVYSPRLDAVGNSVRGIEVCRRFARDHGLHACTSAPDPEGAVRRVYSAREVPSKHQRSAAERAALEAGAGGCHVVEVQGPLYFAAAEMAAHRAIGLAAQGGTVIVDFARAGSIDRAATALLSQLPGAVADKGCQLHFTETAAAPHGAKLLAALEALPGGMPEGLLRHATTDSAIEACEEAVLAAAGVTGPGDSFRLAGLDIFRGIAPGHIPLLESAAATLSYAPGERIITAGEEARAFYVVARGCVNITVPTASGGTRRISSAGPGQTFGEMAMLDGGRRSANAEAQGPVMCHVFSIAQLQELGAQHPAILTAILGNLARDLSDRLRLANEMIHSFG